MIVQYVDWTCKNQQYIPLKYCTVTILVFTVLKLPTMSYLFGMNMNMCKPCRRYCFYSGGCMQDDGEKV